MIALIDGDSISYMLGWHHRDHRDTAVMFDAVDKFLEDIFTLTGADMYMGALADDERSFRYETYKVKPYKGNRRELDEHMVFWKPAVNGYLREKYNFISVPGREADDLIGSAARQCWKAGYETVVCSPDKDLKQISGTHFDYKKNEFCHVDVAQATYNFYKLMLEGDDTDNIAGIPGFGPKKANDKLNPLLERQAEDPEYEHLVKELYKRHFCNYYGELIYNETKMTVALEEYPEDIQIHNVPKPKSPFEMMNRPEVSDH